MLQKMAMNDPHVEALRYRVKHAEDVDYSKAKPLEHEEAGFQIRIENGRAEITMKSHHATAQTARDEVEPFLRAWELTSALRSRPGELEFAYENANIIDRMPNPGATIYAETARITIVGAEVKLRVGRTNYPEPPGGLLRDAAVDLMFERYARYRAGGATLADAAYFCLTVLEMTASGRSGAVNHYSVAATVFDNLGRLTGSKGGKDARKGKAAHAEFTALKRTWLEEAMKVLIRRAAELAGAPSISHPQITMSDLPPLA